MSTLVHRPRFALRCVFAAVALFPALVIAQALRPVVDDTEKGLNPDRAHIEVLRENRDPEILLYANADLTGLPAVELTATGLIVRGKLVCNWSGGRYDPAKSDKMVLRYPNQDATDNRVCPSDFPIKSFRSTTDDGDRSARLFIEVSSRRGPIVEIRQSQASYY